MKEHEKFWAFMTLVISVMLIALLAYFRPIEDGSGSQRVLDAALGGLLLALGASGNALFRIREPEPPEPVTAPLVAPSDEELPDYARG